jgi:hypothetical protein
MLTFKLSHYLLSPSLEHHRMHVLDWVYNAPHADDHSPAALRESCMTKHRLAKYPVKLSF